MKYVLDMHTHTLMSGHGYNTICEMARAANLAGLQALGITEHGPSIPGACNEIYFKNYWVVDRRIDDVELFLGAEMNITDYDGRLDLSPSTQRTLDVGIAGIHNGFYTVGTKAENTRAYIRTIENPCIDIISHPDDGRIPVDYEQLVRAARDFRVLLELNNSSLAPRSARRDGHCADNMKRMLEQCAKHGVRVILGSDAHWHGHVGKFGAVEAIVREADFPEALIVNSSLDVLKSYLSRNRG